MKFKYLISFAISLQCFAFSSLAQTNAADNTWSFVPFSKNKVYYYKGELNDWKQVSVINLWDSLQVPQLVTRIKKELTSDTSTKILLKPTEQGGFDGTRYLTRTADRITRRWTMARLSEKEKELFELKDYDFAAGEKVEVVTPAAMQTTVKKSALFIMIKNDSSIWYKTDTTINVENYTQLDKERTALTGFIDNYLEACTAKKIPPAIYIAYNSKTNIPEFNFIINELERHKIYNYNLVNLPD